ncbi:RHS repeat-associated core domain-containing protein [Pseudomonas moorei]|uniref:RHS repeat-associated core domain-containing protein n=1 Tax=Pseudomonas moorei TaxID=395599 RepID=UPI00200C906F|nr:RHS repeat-associated core domain-containing protein [Pseudomonas moorei]
MTTIADVSTAQRCLGTPTLSVVDNRGLVVRTVQYNRAAVEDLLDELITQQTYSVLGHLSSSIDPRLLTEQQRDPRVPPNFRYVSSLSGQPLKVQSQDAGERLALYDSEGGVIWQQDAREQQLTRTFDTLHRLTTVSERTAGVDRVSEHMIYAESTANTDANLRGQLLQAYSPAGMTLTEAYSITGQLLRSQQQFLQDDILHSDWAGSDSSVWNAALIPETFTTRWTYDALGQVVQTIDAKGNHQYQRFNLAGQLAASELLLVGQTTATAVLQAIDYSAAGQVLHEEAGNGVVTDYVYEPQTQRLSSLRTTRPAQSRRAPVLQALTYQYDPVGNLLAISDDAKAIRYTHNQRVAAVSQYQYDALYQLCQASGRENANAGQQTQALPPAIVPLWQESGELTNYTRTYTYDRGRNLTAVRHVGRHDYTQQMVVASTSNRAVQQTVGLIPQDVDGFFDTCGNLLQLTPGQPLSWDSRNQLLRTTLVGRSGADDDDEVYWYDSQGQRATKLGTALTSGTTRTQRVRYLPGLELRQTEQTPSGGGNPSVTEALNVIQFAATGRQALRVLHWEQGQPADIANNQCRYSLDDQLGSSLLEVDQQADILTWEEYFPFGGTAVWSARNETETQYKFVRYSGKERDATGLYYYGFRYYAPWLGRWLNPDPAGTVDGLNLFCMVGNNPIELHDPDGRAKSPSVSALEPSVVRSSQQNKMPTRALQGAFRGIRKFFMNALGNRDVESRAHIDEVPEIDDMDQKRTREIQKLFADQGVLKLISSDALEENETLKVLKVRVKELDESVKKIPYPFEGTDLIEAENELKSINIKEKDAHAQIMKFMELVKDDISAALQDEVESKKRFHAKIVKSEKMEGGESWGEGSSFAFEEKGGSYYKNGRMNATQSAIRDSVKKPILPRRASYYPSSVRAGLAVYACSPRQSSGSSLRLHGLRAK